MKTVIATLVLLVLVALAGAQHNGDDNTHVSNDASVGINAIISSDYLDAESFHILPGQNVYATYLGGPNLVHIELWVDGAGIHNSVNIGIDRSICAYDNPVAGVDIFLAVDGTLNKPDGGVLITIYDN